MSSTHPAGGRARLRRAVGRAAAEVLEERIALAVYTVTNTADTGPGSLRQAVLDANSSVHVDDTIVFDAAYFSVPREIQVISPLPQFGSGSGGLALIGPGSSLLTVRKTEFGPAVYRRVFDSFSPTLTISGMTITGGNLIGANGAGLSCTSASNVTLDDVVITGNTANTNDGGGIFLSNNATLTIRNSVVTNNSARRGGGINYFDGGSLVMDNCTVSGNTSVGTSGRDVSGGGIYFFGAPVANPPPGFLPGTLLIRNSTISNNVAAGGGGGLGAENMTGTLLVRNSTVSGNVSPTSGGGILQSAAPVTITIEDCTITNNSAGGTTTGTNATGGGGICRVTSYPGTLNITNSIVSGNSNPLTPDILTTNVTTNVQYSAIGSASGFSLSAASNHNIAFGTNLLLGPLTYSGGFTRTHAPLPGSPLINAGSNGLVPAGTTTDQRGAGFPRVAGSAVDIGAVEPSAAAAPPRVAGVYVRGSAWTPAFLTYLDSRGLGDRDVGYLVPAGAGQLATLPWIGIDRVSVRFTDNVGTFANMMTLAGVNVPSYTLGNVTVNASTRTITWALSGPIGKDRLRLTLPGSVSGAGGTLDGEWADAAHAYPSGNGAAGGAFSFAFNVLPGDVNQNGSVLADDFSGVKKRFFKDTSDLTATDTSYSPLYDVTGDGTILANDFSEVKKRFFDAVPAGAAATGLLS